jgi:hypothetical protein
MKTLVFLGVVTGIIIFMGINVTCTKAIADSSDMNISTESRYLDERIANQFRRIDQGIRLGHITRDEKRILIDNLDYVRDQEARFKAEGIFTVAERKQLHTLLDQNSYMIDKKGPLKTLRPGIDSLGIDHRIASLQRRIDQGIISGELTRDEARILQDNLNYIQREEARLKGDRSPTNEERERLHRMLDQNSDIIFDKKNNPVRRFY